MNHHLIQIVLEALTYHYHSTHQPTWRERDRGLDGLQRLTPYTSAPLREVVAQWVERASDFAFMESSVAPQECDQAVKLLNIFRIAEALFHQGEERQKARSAQGLSPLPSSLCTIATSDHELTLIEEVFNLAPQPFLERPQLTRERLIKSLACLRDAIALKSERALLHTLNDPSQDQARSLLAPNSCLMALPCQGVMMEEWRGLFNDDWIAESLLSDPTAAESDEALYHDLQQIWEGVTPDLDSTSDLRSNAYAESPFESLFESLFKPYYLAGATLQLKQMRSDDIISDISSCFITLIDEKRPKDQKVGSFWVNESCPSEITVIFLTRDGRLLAQRDLTWTPHLPESALKAFEIINIKTLTYPIELAQSHPQLLSVLKERYQLRGVSAVALDPNNQIPHLSREAYGALRVGQRYVAPLRFWGRADLIELTRHLVAPHVIECLERSQHLEQLSQQLQDHCSERWLALRKRRLTRQRTQQREWEGVKSERSYTRGDLVDACVVDLYKTSFEVVTVGDGRRGHVKSTPHSIKSAIKLGDIVRLTVLGEHPEHRTLIMSLDQDSKASLRGQKPQTDAQATLNRLNDLFSNSEGRSIRSKTGTEGGHNPSITPPRSHKNKRQTPIGKKRRKK